MYTLYIYVYICNYKSFIHVYRSYGYLLFFFIFFLHIFFSLRIIDLLSEIACNLPKNQFITKNNYLFYSLREITFRFVNMMDLCKRKAFFCACADTPFYNLCKAFEYFMCIWCVVSSIWNIYVTNPQIRHTNRFKSYFPEEQLLCRFIVIFDNPFVNEIDY